MRIKVLSFSEYFYAESKMPLLKNLMQMSTLNIRKAYQQTFRQQPRVVSFIGTSNRFDLTAADIFSELQTGNPAAMRGSNPMRFGQVLLRAGLKRRHTEYGNVYEVVRRQ